MRSPARLLLAAIASLVCTAPAAGREVTKGAITIVDPQMRVTLGRVPNTAAYVAVRNSGARPDRLLSASCACAARVELHAHQTGPGGIGRMTPTPSLLVPARGQAVLAPGGAHLMLFGLKQPVREGGEQRVTLVFEQAGPVTAVFRGRTRIAAPAAAAPHHAH